MKNNKLIEEMNKLCEEYLSEGIRSSELVNKSLSFDKNKKDYLFKKFVITITLY